MARYTDFDELADAALGLADEVREVDPHALYRRLAYMSARDPERAAQLLMTLAAFVDLDAPLSVLISRVEVITAMHPALAG